MVYVWRTSRYHEDLDLMFNISVVIDYSEYSEESDEAFIQSL